MQHVLFPFHLWIYLVGPIPLPSGPELRPRVPPMVHTYTMHGNMKLAVLCGVWEEEMYLEN